MTIREVAVYRYALPLAAPLPVPGAAAAVREGLLLALTGEAGATGWGEAAPLPGFSREAMAEAEEALVALAGALPGLHLAPPDVVAGGRLAREVAEAPPSVRAAVEVAAAAAWGAAHGRPLRHVLFPAAAARVALGALVAARGEAAAEAARRGAAAGFRAVKLKVGRQDVAADAALVRAVRAALGPGVALRLDANRAWTLDEAFAFADAVPEGTVAYVEEPLADPAGLPALAARLPIALDETLGALTPADLEAHRYAAAVVLKPTVLGGPAALRAWVRAAQEHGLRPVLSAAFESGVGMQGLLAMAAAYAAEPAGFDTYRWLTADVLAPRLALDGPTADLEALEAAAPAVALEGLERIA